MTRWRPAVQISLLVGAAVCLAVPAVSHAQTLKYPVGIRGKFTPEGMLVEQVRPDGPAGRAGLQRGDVILKVDGRLITSQQDFVATINSSGGSVVLIVRRGSQGNGIRVGLELVESRGAPPAPYLLGVLGDFSPEGMRVRLVGPGSPAYRAGIAKGDVIVRINNVPITSQGDLLKVLYSSGGTARIDVRKANGRGVRLEADLAVYDLGAAGEFTRDGLEVSVIAPGTPAALVGLRKGDVIVRIDNRPMRSQNDYAAAIKESGGSVTLLVRRGGNRAVQIEVDLINNLLGLWCEPSPEGMRVTNVVPGGPGDAIGLERGDTVVKVDDQRVRTQAELLTAVRAARGLVTLTVRKGRTDRLVRLEADLLR